MATEKLNRRMTMLHRCQQSGSRPWITTVVLFLSLVAGSAQAGKAEPPDLSGAWRLNHELSDDAAAKLSTAGAAVASRRPGRPSVRPMGDDMGSAGGIGGTRPVGPPAHGPRGPAAEQFDPEEVAGRMALLATPSEMVHITYEEPVLGVLDAAGPRRTLYTDGRRRAGDQGRGEISSRSRWKPGGRLVVTSSTDWGREITETLALDAATGRLHISTEVAGPGGPALTWRWIYDPAGPASP
jgi:hypothetical protein